MALYQLVRKLSGNNFLALVAGLVYVTCEDNSMTVGWMSTITDIFCVLFILLSLLCHANWLSRRRPIDLAGTLFMLTLAFLSKETAVAAPIVLVLMTFIMPKGIAEISSEGDPNFRDRVRDYISWAPMLAMLGLYLFIYVFIWGGGNNNLLYTNPFTDQVKFILNLAVHMPIMWLGTFSPVLINFSMMMPQLVMPFSFAGVIVFILWLFALSPLRNSRLVQWAFISYIVALIPQMGTSAGSRGSISR